MLDKRFWDKVRTSDTHFYEGTPCWEWTAQIDRGGYGKFQLNGRPELAHRVSYEDKHGKIPDGLQINHKCRNRCCVNSENHLEVVTNQENAQKGLTGFVTGLKNRLKTHCPRGHEYSGDNLYIHPNGKRDCKNCRYNNLRKFILKRKNGK